LQEHKRKASLLLLGQGIFYKKKSRPHPTKGGTRTAQEEQAW
jgi:hypothetical protein